MAGEPIDDRCAALIADPQQLVVVSAASVWEIAVKRQVGKLRFEGSPTEEARIAGFELLSVTARHAELAGDLPPHHRDPFDRMLVAQAKAEDLRVVTRDPALSLYDVRTVRC